MTGRTTIDLLPKGTPTDQAQLVFNEGGLDQKVTKKDFFGEVVTQTASDSSAIRWVSSVHFFGGVGSPQTITTETDSAGTITVFGVHASTERQSSVYNYLNNNGTVSVIDSGSIGDELVFTLSGVGGDIVITPITTDTDLSVRLGYVKQ